MKNKTMFLGTLFGLPVVGCGTQNTMTQLTSYRGKNNLLPSVLCYDASGFNEVKQWTHEAQIKNAARG
jgi:hypothetical protein